MPRAEIGSTKHLSNQLKSKGLQRLRWYCQACARQMRDENGFKCHVQSESHVRNMMVIGEDPRAAIAEFSERFLSDFVKLLRTGHGEKQVHVNRFYQEYIANKEHVHMNATRWASLTEFAKHLGREGICRVEEEEGEDVVKDGRGGGLLISWIDNSPEALRRQDALRKRERQDRGDEEREWRGIREQIARARREGQQPGEDLDEIEEDESRTLQRKEGERIKLNFGAKVTAEKVEGGKELGSTRQKQDPLSPPLTETPDSSSGDGKSADESNVKTAPSSSTTAPTPSPAKISLNGGPTPKSSSTTTTTTTAPPKHINPLSLIKKSSKPKTQANTNTNDNNKKNQPSSTSTSTPKPGPPRPMSQAERIMRDEISARERREQQRKQSQRQQRQQQQQQQNTNKTKQSDGDAADDHAVKRRRVV